jgi:hypothetical protein
MVWYIVLALLNGPASFPNDPPYYASRAACEQQIRDNSSPPTRFDRNDNMSFHYEGVEVEHASCVQRPKPVETRSSLQQQVQSNINLSCQESGIIHIDQTHNVVTWEGQQSQAKITSATISWLDNTINRSTLKLSRPNLPKDTCRLASYQEFIEQGQ